MVDTTETTTVHTAEVVCFDDPVIITERVAVAAFIAGYTDPTRRSYATDLRIFAGWHDRATVVDAVVVLGHGGDAVAAARVAAGIDNPAVRCLFDAVDCQTEGLDPLVFTAAQPRGRHPRRGGKRRGVW